MLGHMITVSYKFSCHCQTGTLFSIQLQSTTSDSESMPDVNESESLSSSDVKSATIQGEERSSHPTSHLLTTSICTEHCNIQEEGMFKGKYPCKKACAETRSCRAQARYPRYVVNNAISATWRARAKI